MPDNVWRICLIIVKEYYRRATLAMTRYVSNQGNRWSGAGFERNEFCRLRDEASRRQEGVHREQTRRISAKFKVELHQKFKINNFK